MHESIEALIIKKLRDHSLSIATAESCTGGLLAHRFTNIPGASQVFREGMIAYSNESKTMHLRVPEKIIEAYGAVSAEVAAAMADGIQKISNATFGLATTGIAGPDGGSLEKPVGTLFLAIAEQGKRVDVWQEDFSLCKRLSFKEQAVDALLHRFFKYL